MRSSRKVLGLVATAAAAGLVLAACGSGASTSKNTSSGNGSNASGSSQGVSAAFNAATVGFVNQSTKTGGTLKLVASGDCDSWDPAPTYYAWCWNMQRLFTRTLIGYSAVPGANNAFKIQPDMATALGEHSADFKTWTYHLKSGLKWQDGSAVTTDQIKYGVERNFAQDVLTGGPASYFLCTLSTCDAKGNPAYPGPYKDKNGLSTIETPDPNTIVFKLNTAYPDWDYIMTIPASAPVKTTEGGPGYTGAKYTLHPLATGPFKVQSYTPGQKIVFVRNDQWSQSTDTIRKPVVDSVVMTVNANADDNDKALQSGAADAEPDGGVQSTFQAQIATNPDLKKNADNPITGFTRYLAVFPSTIPNIHCRMAIFYAINKVDLQKARGGTYGGDVAHTMAAPIVPGYDPNANPYPNGADNTGDLTKAKSELQACGKPTGFEVKEAYVNSGRAPAVFSASQQALARVGIKITPATHEQAGYYSSFIGRPATVKANNIGLAQAGWGSDYPTGGGFWNSIAASSAPPAGGNYTQINSPTIDGLLKQAASSAGIHADVFKQVDAEVMKLAVDLPYVFDKTLYYRNPRMTNVRNNFGEGSYYDFVNIGTTDGK
jgi:peptide/nickel transport system substrate-binding protein